MRLPQFFSNPWVGFIGTVCDVISIPLAFVLYWASVKDRDLTYYVHPIRTTVLQSGYASGLRVFHKNQEVKTDVTAVQIAIWNNGKEPVLKGDILSPVKIVTRPAVPILEAQVRKQSRDINELAIENGSLHEGIAPLSWKLLEHHDGAAIQLLYVGPPEVEVVVEGIILGQKNITRLAALEVRQQEPLLEPKAGTLVAGIILFLAASVSVYLATIISRLPPKLGGGSRKIATMTIIAALLAVFLGVKAIQEFHLWLNFPEPPFGFQ